MFSFKSYVISELASRSLLSVGFHNELFNHKYSNQVGLKRKIKTNILYSF